MQELIRCESLKDPVLRAIEVTLGSLAVIGFTISLGTGTIEWISVVGFGLLWAGLRPSGLRVGLDGIVYYSPLTTSYHPFELLDNADVQRLGDSRCRITIGAFEWKWVKPFGLDESERISLRQWLISAIEAAKEGVALSAEYSADSRAITVADDDTLLRLSTGLGTSTRVRVLAVANLALRGSERVAELDGITGRILSAGVRRLVMRALKVVTEEDLENLKTDL
jgi:hypothetical protein